MEDWDDVPRFAPDDPSSGLTRRAAIRHVVTLLGGAALVGGSRVEAFAFTTDALDQAMAQGVGSFTATDVALLDEIAETILPETTTPGAKAVKTGAFMALMVTDVYTDRDQAVFRDGMTKLEEACRAATKTTFLQATPAQRLVLLEVLDREQKTAMEERVTIRTRFPPAAAPPPDEPAHYFRMMKELALLGFFTSETGYTRVMRYVESPGRFEPDVPVAPGEKSWASHA